MRTAPVVARRRFSAGRIRPALIILLAALGAGCTQTGDLGRPQASLWTDLAPLAGAGAARARGELVSHFAYTDDEAELRNRAWRFLMPAHERSIFERALADLTIARLLPIAFHSADPTEYHRGLIADSGRSPASRYRRLGEDAAADDLLIRPFAHTAQRVFAADRARLQATAHVRDLHPGDLHHMAARIAENRCLVAWAKAEIERRAYGYRYALERLFLAAPQRESIEAERAVVRLEKHRDALAELAVPGVPNDACPTLADAAVVAAAPVLGK
jgi:hypothetical protein